MNMNREWLRPITAVGVLLLAGVFYVTVSAQQNRGASSPGITTNWVGSLVVGKEDTVDRIAPGPHAQCEARVQLGLRSDGVVVWRPAPVR